MFAGLGGLRIAHDTLVDMSRNKSSKDAAAVSAKPANPFACLTLDSDTESDAEGRAPAEEPVAPPSPPFRTWQTAETDTRFAEMGENKQWKHIFNSPFSRQRRGRRVYREDKNGWTSIEWNKPQFMNDDSTEAEVARVMEAIAEGIIRPTTPPFPPDMTPPPEKVEEEELMKQVQAKIPDQAFPSLLTRNPIVLESTIPGPAPLDMSPEGQQAMVWAERIRRSLERAERQRTPPQIQNNSRDYDMERELGRLSFFRKPVVE